MRSVRGAAALTRRGALLPVLAALFGGLLAAPPVAAAEPVGFEHFHTYAEVKAALDDAVAAHPDIAAEFSIGQSYEERPIWGIKISDNVAVDEAEPEVMFDGQFHALERMSNEMALYLVSLLTDGYATDARIRAIVDSREIWIVPTVNPDGAEFDISNGRFHWWRKNRQPIPGSTAVGVDLNRQFDFKWACCHGSSSKPGNRRYHGPAPWFAPETRAYREFVSGRVVDGRQQIRAMISFHSAGAKILFPYGYTKKNHPRTMSKDDWRTFVALGQQMAALNGYLPEQASDLYIIDGAKNDWAYHEYGIFAFTFELPKGAASRYYPTAAEVAVETERNRSAVLYLLEQADCPYRAAGLAATYCAAG